MIPALTRRSFIATTALTAASLGLPRGAWAATHAPLLLSATSRTLDIDGRAATVWGLVNAEGGIGLTLDPGARFRVDLTNALNVDTIIHWHGQIPPNAQDGVPDIPLPMLKSGEVRHGAGAADGAGYRGGGRERAMLRFRRMRTLQNVRIDPHLPRAVNPNWQGRCVAPWPRSPASAPEGILSGLIARE